MTENMRIMQDVRILVNKMKKQVNLYEKGTIGDPSIVEVEFTPAQITALKQSFAANRTELIGLVNSVTG